MKIKYRFGCNIGWLARSILQRLFLAVMDCVEDGLEAARYMQLPKNAVYIGVDGLLAYEEPIADFLVRATGGKVRENFALSWRQNSPVCLNFIMDRKSNHYVSSPLSVRLALSFFLPSIPYLPRHFLCHLLESNKNRLNTNTIGPMALANA
jgi:hypothetical protein